MHQVMSERVRATDWYTKKLRAFIIQQSDRKVHLRKERTGIAGGNATTTK